MVIIITGASHTGKTLLAQRMLEKYKIPYSPYNQVFSSVNSILFDTYK